MAGLGEITVRLEVRDGWVAAVRVTNTRPLGVASLLKGRTAAEALALVPLLYSLCGMAQKAAATEALVAAGALQDNPLSYETRARHVLAEQVEAHAWTMLLTWPLLVGEEPRPDLLARVRAFTRAMRDVPSAAAAAALMGVLREALLGKDGLPEGGDGWSAWAEAAGTVVGRVVEVVLADGRQKQSHMLPLRKQGPTVLDPGAVADGAEETWAPAFAGESGRAGGDRRILTAPWFANRLATEPHFVSAPTVGGIPREVGPITAWSGSGRLPDVPEAARLAAQLLELASLPARIGSGDDRGVLDRHGDGQGTGCGVVQTSRGPLAHRVRLEGGRVADWQIVAPTEWNFHPASAALQGLVGQPAGPGLERRAALLLAGLDPCVPARVLVQEMADA